MSWKSRALSPRSILPALAVLLVLVAGAAAHANKPVPFGDRVAARSAADPSADATATLDAADLDLRVGPGLEAYHRATGEHAWSYQREGATALYLSMAGENAVVVWDDGLVTSVRPGDQQVRWHRAVPGLADWLRGAGEPGADKRTEEQRKQQATERASAALRTVQQSTPWVAVVTPQLTMGFRDADGDLRYNSKPAGNCVYDPERTVATDYAVLVPRSCANSTGQQVSGGISGYRLDSTGWQLNSGPGVSMKALDGRRVLISDGPIVTPRVFDTWAAAPEAACGSAAEPFAAVPPAGGCTAPDADSPQAR
ncbi:hypothetical protein [Kitasatospora sp. MBT66]|uniref:hypothetical protein n=1 Tax=Kitasatospora sp. MBT66 TaxID=1444769 RepID=UPI0005BC6548|nr:hypothetical protein [Kitasatospora sp. MBT66]